MPKGLWSRSSSKLCKNPESYNFVSMSLGFGVCFGVKFD